MAVNLTTVLTQALQYLGILASGETASTDEKNDGLASANLLLDNWSSDRLMAISELINSFATAASTQSYTIGAAQTWNMARPVAIIAAAAKLTSSGGAAYVTPIKVVSAVEWTAIPDRNSTTLVPTALYYDRGFPFGKVYLSQVPAETGAVEITAWVALTQFADLTTAITFAPGYQLAFTLALAMLIAPQYNVTPTGDLMEQYKAAMATVRQLNASLVGPEPQVVGTSAAPMPQGQ